MLRRKLSNQMLLKMSSQLNFCAAFMKFTNELFMVNTFMKSLARSNNECEVVPFPQAGWGLYHLSTGMLKIWWEVLPVDNCYDQLTWNFFPFIGKIYLLGNDYCQDIYISLASFSVRKHGCHDQCSYHATDLNFRWNSSHRRIIQVLSKRFWCTSRLLF